MINRKLILAFIILLIAYYSLGAQNQQWLWAKGGGSIQSQDAAYGLTRDHYGNTFLTGMFERSGIFGADSLAGQPFCNEEVLVAVLNPQGQWGAAVRAGGLGWDDGRAIAVNSAGQIYVVGKYDGATFPHADFGSHTLTGSGSFVGKLSQNLVWQSVYAIDGYAYDVAVDNQGNCYVIGYFLGTATFGNTTLTSEGDHDIYIAKLASNGIWQWAVRAGGTAAYGYDDRGYGLALDSEGNVFITGYFCGTANFGDTVYVAQNYDIFVAKLDSSGNWLWAKKAGGSNMDKGYDIKVDSDGNCYVTGGFMGGWFGDTHLTALSVDVFITKLDPNGNFLWAKKGGGSSLDEGNGLALDASDNCYITGYFTRDATFGTTVLDNVNDSNDIFVVKLDSDGNWVWAIRSGGANTEIANAIDVSPSGRCYIAGKYYANTSFGTHNISSTGGANFDVFVASLGVVPPLDPENLEITKTGDDISLQWDAVTQNTNGTTITPLHYNVYYVSIPDPDAPITFLESVTETSYTHTDGALGADTRFYLVKAVLQD